LLSRKGYNEKTTFYTITKESEFRTSTCNEATRGRIEEHNRIRITTYSARLE